MGHEKPVRVPLPADEAVADFLKVKPTEDMPRPGTHASEPKKRARKKGAKKK